MTDNSIARVPGMRDINAPTYGRIRQTINELQTAFENARFEAVETPLLEETELFVRKAGGELSGRLYTFTDPGGHSVSLRPEFTSSIIRYYIQESESLEKPVRWQYSGPVFRYGPDRGSEYRQFNQFGAEVIGSGGTATDTEVIYLACSSLRRLGLENLQLRIGHLGVLHDILSNFGLSESSKLFIIRNISDLKTGKSDVDSLAEKAEEIGVVSSDFDPEMSSRLDGFEDDIAEELVSDLLKDNMPTPIGRRTTEQIMARLLKKTSQRDMPEDFRKAVSTIEDISRIEGSPESAISQTRTIAKNSNLNVPGLDDLEALFSHIPASLFDEVNTTLDLGLARGISYYTGVIFELMLGDDDRTSLGGGGRYDGLVKALGGAEETPAMGFAYNIDNLVDVLVSLETSLERV